MLTRERIELVCSALAETLDQSLPEMLGVDRPVGFALMLFDFGERGSLAYVSNADRDDMIRAVREWMARAEAGLMADPPGPRADS